MVFTDCFLDDGLVAETWLTDILLIQVSVVVFVKEYLLIEETLHWYFINFYGYCFTFDVVLVNGGFVFI